MAKTPHPGKSAAIAKYQELFLKRLQQHISYTEFREYREKILNDPALGITAKALDRAEDQALERRKKELSKV